MVRWLLGLGLVSSLTFAAPPKMKVSVEDKDGVITLSFEELGTSQCQLFVNRLALDREEGINLEVGTIPNQVCLPAVGVSRGKVEFEHGQSFPNLNRGSYRLQINGESYGNLIIDHYGAFITGN